MFYSCKVVPQEIQVKVINLQNKMAVKVTKKVKYATALYHKINATRITFYMKSFMLFSKSAHLLDYATLLIVIKTMELCHTLKKVGRVNYHVLYA